MSMEISDKKTPNLGNVDPCSFSNPEKVKVTELELFWDIDFDKHILSGKVNLKCEKQENVKTNHVVSIQTPLKNFLSVRILDSKELLIKKVTNFATNEKLEYDLSDSLGTFGSSLSIKLPEKEEDNNVYNICIEYDTSPEASALQWLTPEQTLGKQAPFLFSQCQAIHCRSIIPCQDTPSAKCTYKAEVTSPKDLLVLMSALTTEKPVAFKKDKLLWKFAQNVPIPSYLIAIVAGRLKGKLLGGKTRVYSEPEIINECGFEFSETDKMLHTAIRICGPYVWTRYDLLVLPPSFPYGGMENPCLTFVTPTLLAGDKSLANVVAHEIAHSWTGNLVTNANFEHFWLNEGFTTYVERKIIGQMYGEPHRHFHAVLGLSTLRDTIMDHLGETNPLTCLVPKLKQIDPDDAFSSVPYEKGHTLLFYLETLLNHDGFFNKFLQSWLEKYKYKTVKTDDFKNYLYEFFKDKVELLDTIDWNTWFYCPGMPPVIPDYDKTLINDVDELVLKWKNWVPTDECLFGPNPFNSNDMDNFISAQKSYFFTKLLEAEPLPLQKLKLMNQTYKMDTVMNSEIRFRWLRVCIKGKWAEKIPAALRFVNEQGRMKFVRPIYRDLYHWEEARQAAIDNFQKNKQFMMFVLSDQLKKDLHLNNTE